MRKFITAPILAEMVILSTFIADCLMYQENVKHRNKQALNKALRAREDILKRVSVEKNSDEQIYKASEDFFDKYYFRYAEKSKIIYICRGVLKSYLNNYRFGDSFYNLFKKLHKNSENFEAKNFDISENQKIDFIKELKSLTQTAEIEVK